MKVILHSFSISIQFLKEQYEYPFLSSIYSDPGFPELKKTVANVLLLEARVSFFSLKPHRKPTKQKHNSALRIGDNSREMEECLPSSKGMVYPQPQAHVLFTCNRH